MTEKNCPDVSGRVFLLTGGTEGIGYELCKILHGANGTVYLTSRTSSKAEAAAEKICAEYPHSKGRVEGLQLDLTDLKSVKACAEEFLKREQKLDVLFNNAGVQMLPLKGKTVQGHEIRMGANCLGHYLLTEELIQTLKATAALRREEGAPEGCVRILWAGSCTLDLSAPRGGVELDGDGAPKPQPSTGGNYGQSKAGNLFLAKPFREKLKQDGILSIVSHHPPSLPFLHSPVLTSIQCFNPATSTTATPCAATSNARISRQSCWSGSSCTRSPRALTRSSGRVFRGT